MPLCAKYGIIADIHANYVAMKVALDFLQAAGAEKILCLGDIVGYGAQPFECIEALKDRPNIFTIAGNHDRNILDENNGFRRVPGYRDPAATWLEWTKDNISPSNARYLKQLPDAMTIDETFIMVHGSLVERDAYILNPSEISRNLNCMTKDFPTMKVCFFGHTHIPMLINTKSVQTELRETKTFQLDPRDIYLINPGSVGQPRDKCPLAAFGIFDAENWRMTFYRKPYDYMRVKRLIADMPIPDKFKNPRTNFDKDENEELGDEPGSGAPKPKKPPQGSGHEGMEN